MQVKFLYLRSLLVLTTGSSGFTHGVQELYPPASRLPPTGFKASTHWLQGLYSLASGDLPTDFGVFICRGIGTYPVVI